MNHVQTSTTDIQEKTFCVIFCKKFIMIDNPVIERESFNKG